MGMSRVHPWVELLSHHYRPACRDIAGHQESVCPHPSQPCAGKKFGISASKSKLTLLVVSLELYSQTADLEKFRHGTSGVVSSIRPTAVASLSHWASTTLVYNTTTVAQRTVFTRRHHAVWLSSHTTAAKWLYRLSLIDPRDCIVL